MVQLKKKIGQIIDKACKEFKPAKFKTTSQAVYFMGETKSQYFKRLEHNFIVYANALEKIMQLVWTDKERKKRFKWLNK